LDISLKAPSIKPKIDNGIVLNYKASTQQRNNKQMNRKSTDERDNLQHHTKYLHTTYLKGINSQNI
jgi:hypothetical protein